MMIYYKEFMNRGFVKNQRSIVQVSEATNKLETLTTKILEYNFPIFIFHHFIANSPWIKWFAQIRIETIFIHSVLA